MILVEHGELLIGGGGSLVWMIDRQASCVSHLHLTSDAVVDVSRDLWIL